MRDNLRKARKDAGMTKQAIASAVGITERYYSMLEGGYRKGSESVWLRLGDLLEVSPGYLLEVTKNAG